jgi:putative membrane protein
MKKHLLIGTAALMLAAPGFAQTGTPATRDASRTPASTKASATAADSSFVMEAAKGGMAEVELGKLAADKASNPDVKKFGQKMADDHAKANDELKTIAANKSITLPSALDAKDAALRDRLSKLSGEAFDKAYMQAMVNDHVKDVNAFRKESTSGKDSDVKAFASKTLPTLEEHLTMARTTDRAVVATSGSKTTTKTGTTGTSPTSPNAPTPNAPTR